jgi:hypothetical protein
MRRIYGGGIGVGAAYRDKHRSLILDCLRHDAAHMRVGDDWRSVSVERNGQM